MTGRTDDLRAFTEIVQEWRENLKRLDRLSRHFTTLGIVARGDDFKRNVPTLEILCKSLGCTYTAFHALHRVASACDEAATKANSAQAATINDAAIDPARMFEVAQQVHFRVFGNDEQTEFPIELTASFVATDDALETARQVFTGVSKLPFTSPQLETLDGNLVSWFGEYTARQAFATALARLQRRLGLEPVRDDHADTFFADLGARIAVVAAQGCTPIVLIASGSRTDYLSPYRLPEDGDVPAGFVIRAPDSAKKGLHATVNGVEVFEVPMILSRYLVLPREWLTTLRYQRRYGDLGVSVHAENEVPGKIDIAFEFACEFEIPQ